MEDPQEITQLLVAWGDGDGEAFEQLVPLVERELHKIAHRYMRKEKPGHTLQTTALVNEAYLKLVNQTRAQWKNRAQFFAVAAESMRRILVDHAKANNRKKRGGKGQKVSLSKVALLSPEQSAELLAFDEALGRLSEFAPRRARVALLRFFGGLTFEEMAKVLDISAATAQRDWVVAEAWIKKEMARQIEPRKKQLNDHAKTVANP